MLNRFKNAFYGSSSSDDTTRSDCDYRETVFNRKIRDALTRSASFRDDLLKETHKNKTLSKVASSAGLTSVKSPTTCSDGSANSSNNGTKQYSNANGSLTASRSQSNQQIRSGGSSSKSSNSVSGKQLKFRYSRPEFLQLKTDDEIAVSADHQIRPIILPRDVSRLPWRSGYAECINAGKSLFNEDQAACHQDVTIQRTSTLECTELISIGLADKIPWTYFGIFDGHAGSAVAVAAAAQLHTKIGEKLNQITDLLIALELDYDTISEDEYTDCDSFSQSELIDYPQPLAKKETNPSRKKATRKEVSTNEEKKPETTKQQDPVSTNVTSDADLDPEQEAENAAESSSSEPRCENKTCDNNENLNQDSTSCDASDGKNKETSAKENLSSTPMAPHTSTATHFFRPERSPVANMMDICRHNITVDSLIKGALESAFWEMDSLIAQDKRDYRMPGGCTAIVGLFILGKLYVCNAGDSRAIVCKGNQVIPMSYDFTPVSERERILRLGMQRPELLGSEFTHLEFIRRPTKKDLGKPMLYKDAYMSGWSTKTISYEDLKFPLVWGEGKRSRVLATIGVTRGFGDHELRAQCGSVLIKPFLTPEPEVKILPLEYDKTLTAEDVLIMGSDGLWDVITNQEAAEIVESSFDLFPDNHESRSKYRYITAAQDLVIHSRGHTDNWGSVWRTNGGEYMASLDDIAVFVIPLKQYRDEYLEWKKLRQESISQQSQLKSSGHSSSLRLQRIASASSSRAKLVD